MLSQDGQVALVFNGEIYDFQEHRQALVASGHAFVGHSDTEVLLHLYQVHGPAMLGMFHGMFALAVWDRRRNSLLLARDPSGIKPLFLRRGPDVLAFASEIKALLVDPRFERQPDLVSLAAYLSYLYVPPPATAFAGIERLLPGEALMISPSGEKRWRYHHFEVTPKRPMASLDAVADSLDALLNKVVAQQQVADVPVGAFLSGGIDSALLVAMMAKQRQAAGSQEPLVAFTVGFSGPAADETADARAIAQQLGVQHRVLTLDAEIAHAGIDAVVEQFDEPFANPTALLVEVLCGFARKEVTVALTGDGGDEAFGGYPRYRATRALGLWSHLPSPLRKHVVGPLVDQLPEGLGPQFLRDNARRLRRFVHAADGDFAPTYRDWLGHYTLESLHELLMPEAGARVQERLQLHGADLGRTLSELGRLGTGVDPLDAACLADVYGFLPDNVLALSDRMSMRHALELRVPFADDRVIDFGLRLEPKWKMTSAALLGSRGRHASKRVLRHLAARYVAGDAASRPKQGFVAPMQRWLAGPLAPLLDSALAPDSLHRRGLVRSGAVQRMRAEHASGARDHTWHLWALLILERWWQLRIDRPMEPVADREVATQRWN